MNGHIDPDVLGEFGVGPRKFLERHKGVQQRLYLSKIRVKIEESRERRNFHYPGIDVMTPKGLICFNKILADQIKIK